MTEIASLTINVDDMLRDFIIENEEVIINDPKAFIDAMKVLKFGGNLTNVRTR